MTIETQSRSALRELIELLQEIDRRWSGPEWNLNSPQDVSASHRALMHILEAGLVGFFEQDAASPELRRITTPSRKLTGDNPDAIYFDAPVSAGHVYRVHGTLEGAAYFSVTVEEGTAEGHIASNTAGVLNSEQMHFEPDGSFTLYLGGAQREGNWLGLPPGASRITTRHYFEHTTPAAANPDLEPRMRIECIDVRDTAPPPGDAEVAAGIRRVANMVRSRTLDMPPMANREPPAFLALTPNEFPQPVPPGDFGLAAFDAHYSMAPYFLNPGEALEITGRWPDCCFANVCLWNRFQQTLDYRRRQVSLNRAQTKLEKDGSFRLYLAAENPGLPNWIDTEGNPFGLVFWRFFMVRGEVEKPTARVVSLVDLD